MEKLTEKELEQIKVLAYEAAKSVNTIDADCCTFSVEIDKKYISISVRVIDCNKDYCEETDE